MVPQQREDLGALCVSKTMNHQGMLKCELVSGHQKSLWSMQALRMNLTHMCVTPILRTSYKAKRRYVVTREEAAEHEGRAEAARQHAAAQDALAAASQYGPSYNFGY